MRKRSQNPERRRLGSQGQRDFDSWEQGPSGRGAEAFGSSRYRDRSNAAYRETARQRTNSPTPEVSESYSVSSSQARYAAAGKRQRKKRRIVAGVVAALALAFVVAGSALGFFANINRALHDGLDSDLFGVLTRVTAGQPFYVLLLGTDESIDRQDDEEMAGVFRSDTMILARVDPGAQTLSLVSIPRDTQVDLGEHGVQKINAAHAFGGSALAVTAVEDLTGVGISHYVEIDFDGFIGLVDTLGGVEVDVPMTIDDIDAGGHVDAGYQTLDSWQALTLCRARNAYEEVVGEGDLYRAANQRLVLGAIVKKILASDPATMTSAINSCAEFVRTDMNVGDILDLAQRFSGFDTEHNLYSAVFPVTPYYDEYDEIWWDLPDQEAWATMRARMEEGGSPAAETLIDPVTGTILAQAGSSSSSEGDASSSSAAATQHTGTVSVRNGSLHDGAAASAASVLSKMGFTTDADNADADDYPNTLVVYDSPAQQAEAQQIADALGVGTPVLNEGEYAFEGDFLVVIGADFA